MKIDRVHCWVLPKVRFPRVTTPAWAGRPQESIALTFIKITTDEGVEGFAEIPAKVDESFLRQLIGLDPFNIEEIARILRLQYYTWGIEIALWDIIGKVCGQPLAKLWGGYQARVKAYASLVEVGTPEQRAEDASGFYDEGFRALKLRLHLPSIEEDLALVEAVRSRMGDKMEIMVDANQAQSLVTPSVQAGIIWDYYRAYATAKALEDLNVRWLEEPLSRYDYDGLTRLSAAVNIPIAGGEHNQYLHEFRTLIENNCYDIVQPDCLHSETVWQMKKIAALAEMHVKLCIPHHGGGGLGTIANLHFSTALPNSPYLEIMRDRPGEKWPAQDFITSFPLPSSDGFSPLPSNPGLGIELDLDRIKSYADTQLVIS